MSDCRLCSLTLLGLMESRISRVRPQRVYDLAINLTPPLSLFIDASAPALFSSPFCICVSARTDEGSVLLR